MRKLYFDITQADYRIYIKDTEVIPAGTSVNAMSVKHKNSEYQRFADEYDIHFIFEDDVPKIEFYTVPMVDIFAVDSNGGYIGSIGQATDLEGDVPICYIDADKKSYLIAENGKEFLTKAHHWKRELAPYNGIEFFESIEVAQEQYEFLDRNELENY